jgi:signal peptidase I
LAKKQQKKPKPEAKPVKKKKGFVRDWTESILWAVVFAVIIRMLFIQAFKIPSGSMENTLLIGDFLLVNKVMYPRSVVGLVRDIPFVGNQIADGVAPHDPSSRARALIIPGIRKPHRGDVIIFRAPHAPMDFIKRCIGVEGDTIRIKDKRVFVNGKEEFEPVAIHRDPNTLVLDSFVTAQLEREGYQHLWETRQFLDKGQLFGYQGLRDQFGPVVVPKGNCFMMGDNRDNSLDSRYWGPMPIENTKGRAVVIYWSWDSPGSDPIYMFWKKIRWGRLFTPIW